MIKEVNRVLKRFVRDDNLMESPDLPIEVSLSASGVYIFRCQLCQVRCKQTKNLFICKNGKNICKKSQKKYHSVAGVV